MNNKAAVSVIAVALCLGLSACADVKEAVGYTKEAPDEFAVYKRAPLSLPPGYALRPPAPGSARPDTVTPKTRAKKALLGGRAQTVANSDLSMGEQALLRNSHFLKTNRVPIPAINIDVQAAATHTGHIPQIGQLLNPTTYI